MQTRAAVEQEQLIRLVDQRSLQGQSYLKWINGGELAELIALCIERMYRLGLKSYLWSSSI